MQINNKQNLKTLSINHLLEIRSHLGHKIKYINRFSEGFVLGNIDNISIYHIERIWKSLRVFYEVLSHSFFRRNTFFLILTNKNIPSEFISESFYKSFIKDDLSSRNLPKSFYVLGYIHKDWYGGLLANWTRIYLLLKKFLFNKTKLTKKRIKIIKRLKGVWTRQLNPNFPDFVLTLDSNFKAFHETRLIRLPILGLADVNTNPFNLSFYVPGNDDSIDNVEFFLKFIEESIEEGRLKEQELFYHLMMARLQKILEEELF